MRPWNALIGETAFFLVAIVCSAVIATQAASPFKEETKTCHPDCTKYGNCNGETGQCDCPFGLSGPTCTDRLFPACHSTKDHGSLPHYGTLYPKNCECVKQLREHPLSCPGYLHFDGQGSLTSSNCLYDILLEHNLLCYRYKNWAPSEQLSDSPAIADPNVEWFHVKAYPAYTEAAVKPEDMPREVDTRDGGTWRPLSECPNNCSGRGWCQVKGGDNFDHHGDENERWCKCHSFFKGSSCEVADPLHCYRNCSGAGTCLGGWCHCQPGYWGMGCTRTKAYTSSVGWRPNHAEIKIYVYELPSYVVHRRAFNDDWSTIDLMYNAELEFTEKLLADWTVRTENPWEAALFYVPMYTYWYTGNIGHPYYIIQHVVHQLQHLSPFFNLTGGRNHVMWATNDRGTCKLQHAPVEMQHPIKIVHFGQSPRNAYLTKAHLYGGSGSAGASQHTALPLPGHRFEEFPEFNVMDLLEEYEICVRPEKDVVSPNYLHEVWVEPKSYSKVWNTTLTPDGDRAVKRLSSDSDRRRVTFFFAGYTKDTMVYSQGVRQAMHRMFGKGGKHDPDGPNARPDWKVQWPNPDAVNEMQKAKFCLAPMGAGWGIRLAEAMVSGCVPVIVQDHVYQPLWDVLPFEEFSIRLSRADVADIVNILDDVTPEQFAKLQVGVEKYHRAFIWDEHYGGLAYNFTIVALRRRALSLWSVNFHHRHHHRRLSQSNGQLRRHMRSI